MTDNLICWVENGSSWICVCVRMGRLQAKTGRFECVASLQVTAQRKVSLAKYLTQVLFLDLRGLKIIYFEKLGVLLTILLTPF